MLIFFVNKNVFLGCIKEFYIDDKLIDFLQAARKRHAVDAGCYTRQLGMPTSAYSVSQVSEIKNLNFLAHLSDIFLFIIF